jgi:hypothetical protein
LYTIAPTSRAHIVPAKSQAERSERAGDPGGVAPATARPQRWQNRACGESWAPHPSQLRCARLAPQLLQNRPDAELPHEGQVVVGVVIGAGR